jgi:hypothetical protein
MEETFEKDLVSVQHGNICLDRNKYIPRNEIMHRLRIK